MDTTLKPSSNSSKPKKVENRRLSHNSMYAHRDTGEAAPAFPVTASHGRIGPGYFRSTYSDLINHCNKLSTYDE